MQYYYGYRHYQIYVLSSKFFSVLLLSCLFSLISRLFFKLFFVVVLILLFCSFNVKALSAVTIKIIQGSEPYLTFDKGKTKVTDANILSVITFSDGTTMSSTTNTSSSENPIALPKEGETIKDISMMIPIINRSINLKTIIGPPYSYWGDDDGDGQGADGISATGNISVNVTDKNGSIVNADTALDICKAPYLIDFDTSGVWSLSTKYGIPNIATLYMRPVKYYIKPNSAPAVCMLVPSLFASPANTEVWRWSKGFYSQSRDPATYERNFPTTGGNNLFFDLEISGIDESELTWPPVTHEGITATVTRSEHNELWLNPTPKVVTRVTLTGPAATTTQQSSNSPGAIFRPQLPQTFELVGYDRNNKPVIKYGFILKQWFIARGKKLSNMVNHQAWCNSTGYRVPLVKDLTNAIPDPNSPAENQGFVGAKPESHGNYFERQIGAGFMSEWGVLDFYNDAVFTGAMLITSEFSDASGVWPWIVNMAGGGVYPKRGQDPIFTVICAYP